MPGSIKESQPANDEVHQLTSQVKPEVESKTGKSFDTFAAKEFATQVI